MIRNGWALDGKVDGSTIQPRLVAERLERDIQLLARELVLLRAPAALDEVPWPVIKAPTMLTFTSQLFSRNSPDILRYHSDSKEFKLYSDNDCSYETKGFIDGSWSHVILVVIR